jgi:hypothetical protein
MTTKKFLDVYTRMSTYFPLSLSLYLSIHISCTSLKYFPLFHRYSLWFAFKGYVKECLSPGKPLSANNLRFFSNNSNSCITPRLFFYLLLFFLNDFYTVNGKIKCLTPYCVHCFARRVIITRVCKKKNRSHCSANENVRTFPSVGARKCNGL